MLDLFSYGKFDIVRDHANQVQLSVNTALVCFPVHNFGCLRSRKVNFEVLFFHVRKSRQSKHCRKRSSEVVTVSVYKLQ